jgi:hypothetical protein
LTLDAQKAGLVNHLLSIKAATEEGFAQYQWLTGNKSDLPHIGHKWAFVIKTNCLLQMVISMENVCEQNDRLPRSFLLSRVAQRSAKNGINQEVNYQWVSFGTLF